MAHSAQNYETLNFDIVIIGAGGAGLRAAIAATEEASAVSGKKPRVAIICKSLLGKAHTVMAEGGMAAALANMDGKDSWEMHFRDTMKGGKMMSNWKMAEIHAKEAPERVRELERYGAVFDRNENGDIHQRPFGGHTFARLAHVGDRTGLEMIRTLQDKAVHQDVEVFMEWSVAHLFTHDGAVTGLLAYNRNTGDFAVFQAKAVIMATGGCARAYRVQTNSWEGTGDGHALAYEAGADLIDMEFMQFHPTGMVWPLSVAGILVTEGVRGEGGILRNAKGERFMFNYIPEAFKNDVADTPEEAQRWVDGDQKNNRKPPELLTRDVVARAILAEIKAGRGSLHGGVFLDIATQRDANYIRKALPSMYHQFMKLADTDITKEAMEVGPTAHYIMGGIRVNPETTESTVRGLFASGEVAAGLHGANRLGGNSLTDLLVFGRRSGLFALEHAQKSGSHTVHAAEVKEAVDRATRYLCTDKDVSLLQITDLSTTNNPFAIQTELKKAMDEQCGIVREEKEIKQAITAIDRVREKLPHMSVKGSRAMNTAWHAALALESLLTVSEAMARSAIERRESRGGHTRSDYPNYDSALAAKNIVVRKSEGGMKVMLESLPQIPESYRKIIEKLDQ